MVIVVGDGIFCGVDVSCLGVNYRTAFGNIVFDFRVFFFFFIHTVVNLTL